MVALHLRRAFFSASTRLISQMLELGCLLMVEPRTDAIRDQLDTLITTELPSTLGKKKLMCVGTQATPR